jgi:hypothetical protein
VTPRRGSHPKTKSRDAWAEWKATGSVISATAFLDSVSSWTQGTAAQLLRPNWPRDTHRPSSTEVEERLRYSLGLSARRGEGDYVDALGAARRDVLEELREARDTAPEVTDATAGGTVAITNGRRH